MLSVVTETPQPRDRLLAAGLALLLLATTAATLPIASRPWPVVTAFLPIYASAVVMADGITTYLLTMQFLATRVPMLGLLAMAYAYTTPLVAVHLLVFPGVFGATGLLGAGTQTAVWVWVFWHVGYALLVAASVAVARRPAPAVIAAIPAGALLPATIGLPLALATLVTTIALDASAPLPTLIDAGDYTPIRDSPLGRSVIGLGIAALALLVWRTRLRSVLHLWLAIALLAHVCSVLINLASGVRFGAGWYLGRCMSLVTATVILGVMLREVHRLYARLAAANRELAELATRDGLTGLYNRRHFDLRLTEELRRAQRNGEALSLLLIDVDHFKPYNDAFGHPAGDACLQRVAALIAAHAQRPGDLAARYGGEEFTLILPGADAAAAYAVAERLRRAVVAAALPAPQGVVTVSIGCSSLRPLETEGTAPLLARADAALYRAKQDGRNRALAA